MGGGPGYWLLDEIAFAERSEKRVAAEQFQLGAIKATNGRTMLHKIA
jgi:hypothetical protein